MKTEKPIETTKGLDYVRSILRKVSEETGIPVPVITEKNNNKTRKREVVFARQLAMYFSKQYTKLSLAVIGAEIGGKDHATVLHACKTINNLYDTDKNVRQTVLNLTPIILHAKPTGSTLVCAVCGSSDLERKMWVRLYDGKPVGTVSDNDTVDQYCNDCKANVAFITAKDYEHMLNVKEMAEEDREMENEAHAAVANQEYENQLNKLEKDLGV